MTDAINKANMIKGFLLAKESPRIILEAIDEIIKAMPTQTISGPKDFNLPDFVTEIEQKLAVVPPRMEEEPSAPEPKKKRKWSPEAKAAAAERMRKAREAKLSRKTSEATTGDTYRPVAPDLGDYIGTREDGKLMNSDWPDIRNMLNRLTRESIAGKYGVAVEYLNEFIATKQVSDKLTPDDSVRLKPITEPTWDFKNENLGAVD